MKKKYKKNERKGYKYTEEELDYISQKLGVISKESIAKALGRSVQSIEKIALKHFGTAKGNAIQGYFNSEELSYALGVWKGAVAVWIRERGLPAKAHKKNLKYKLAETTNDIDTYSIDIDVFYEWLEKNKNNVKIDFSKVDIDSFIGCPEWFMEDCRNKTIYHVGTRVEWSEKEVNQLLHLFYNEGKTIKEIAEILGRSYISVRKKKQYLNDKNIFVPLTKVA